MDRDRWLELCDLAAPTHPDTEYASIQIIDEDTVVLTYPDGSEGTLLWRTDDAGRGSWRFPVLHTDHATMTGMYDRY
jgi:hypothetical protein